MNKTAIISFIIDKVALKLRNFSSNMRKRIDMVIEDKEIRVKEYDSRLLILNGWVKLGKKKIKVKDSSKIKKGISNYTVKSQELLDKLISLNTKIKLSALKFKPEKPITVDKIDCLEVNETNYSDFQDCHFRKVTELELLNLNSLQITVILSKINKTDTIRISSTNLSKLDLSQFRFNQVYFQNFEFSDILVLPCKLQHLSLIECKQLKNLKFKATTEIYFVSHEEEPLESNIAFIERLRKVKKVYIDPKISFSQIYVLLPSSIREIDYLSDNDLKNIDPLKFKQHFPYLIQFFQKIPIDFAQTLSLRHIWPEMTDVSVESSWKPRKIFVEYHNCIELSKHPEIFEEAEEIMLSSEHFRLDCLSEKIKKLVINCFVSSKS